MSKNENTVSDIFVKKICEKMLELLTKKEIVELWLRSGGSNSRVAYAMSILLGRGVIERICSGLYRIQNIKKEQILGSSR
jgi:predicted transcriptional regulator of viral defense system